MAAQRSALVSTIPGRSFFPGRSASLSAQIIGDVRDALFAKKLKPGDVLGTENEIAARYGVSRIVARDALRTLEALGIAEIRMGKGGGAAVARGNPRLFAEALAVQLDLTGVTPAEIMDAQRAIECLAAELGRRERHRRRHRAAARHRRRFRGESPQCRTPTTQHAREFHLPWPKPRKPRSGGSRHSLQARCRGRGDETRR
jgi:GntR family transcriptional repressor for pyruvate dehydrogenase complex